MILTSHRRRPRLGRPVSVSSESEKWRYVAGRKTIPTHFSFNMISMTAWLLLTPASDSAVYPITTQIKIRINARATLSRRLNANA